MTGWYERVRFVTPDGCEWPRDPARMSRSQAHTALWRYHRWDDCPDVTYADGDYAVRCAIAINQGCVGLPKCSPAQCRCGAIRNPEPVRRPVVRRSWTPERGWVVVEVRV